MTWFNIVKDNWVIFIDNVLKDKWPSNREKYVKFSNLDDTSRNAEKF